MSIQRQTPSKLRQYANTAFLENNERVSQTAKKQFRFEESLSPFREDQDESRNLKSEFDIHTLKNTNGNNSHITIQKLQKKLALKQTESELWKQKYEKQINQILTIKANYEKDIKQFKKDAKFAQDRADEYQKNNDPQISTKRFSLDQSDTQIRKMRQQQQDDDIEIKRLLDDNQQLRQTIAYMDLDKQSEIDDLQRLLHAQEYIKFDNYQMNHLEREIEQLHKLIDVKNDEIENISNENISQKDLYEQELDRVKNLLERQICDVKFNARDDLNSFELQMGEIHRKEVVRLNIKFENQLSEIEGENIKLREILDYHNLSNTQLQQQLNTQCKEQDLKNMKLLEGESLRNRMQLEHDDKLRKLSQQILLDHQRDEEREIILQQQQKDISELSLAIQYMGDERNQMEDFNQTYIIEIEQLKLKIYETELEKNKIVEIFQKQIDNIESHNRDRIRQFSLQIENYDLEVKRSKEITESKSREIDNLLIQLNLMERENRRMRDEIDDLRAEIIHQEHLRTQVIDMKSSNNMDVQYRIENQKKQSSNNVLIRSSTQK